jgi:hypothetical protein
MKRQSQLTVDSCLCVCDTAVSFNLIFVLHIKLTLYNITRLETNVNLFYINLESEKLKKKTAHHHHFQPHQTLENRTRKIR